MELARESDFPATLTQDEFAKSLQPIPTFPQLQAARRKILSIGDIKLRQCKVGELSSLGTVLRQDICVRYSLRGSDVRRINDLADAVKVWRQAALLK